MYAIIHNRMIKEQKDFPLLQTYKQYFEITEKTIFALYPDIYTNYELTPDLLIHEQIHFKQQEKLGVDEWVNRYIDDKDFRLEQEIEAYKNQINSIKDRNARERMKVWASNILSSKLYGNIINSREAYKKL